MHALCDVRAAVAAVVLLGLAPMTAAAAELGYGYRTDGPGPGHAELAALLPPGDTLADEGVAGSDAEAAAELLNRLLAGAPPAVVRLDTDARAENLVAAGVMADLGELAAARGWTAAGACRIGGKIVCVPVSAGSTCVSGLFFPAQAEPALTAAQYRLAAAAIGAGFPARHPAPDCDRAQGRQ
jgi:hypothetical protein